MASSDSTNASILVVSIAGWISIVGACGIALFQLLLALGLPLGKAAWGGASKDLSTSLRICSAVAVVVWLFVAHVLAIRSGIIGNPTTPSSSHFRGVSFESASRITWIVLGLLCVSCVLNWISRSPLERNIWGPTTTILVMAIFVVARSNQPEQRSANDDSNNKSAPVSGEKQRLLT